MLDSGRNFNYLLHSLISSVYFRLTMFHVIHGFLKINPVMVWRLRVCLFIL